LHAALRETLGNHVAQKGSYVGPDRLRFDFSHSKQIEQNQLKIINKRVNYFIDKNDSVETKLMSPEKAIKAGAMALFGEKYGEEVRVVSMGKHENISFSLELCGGTHVHSTGEIGKFMIINESSIASGVRRIEALRDKELKKYLENKALDQKNKIIELENKFNEILEEIKLNGGSIEKFKDFDEQKILSASNYLKELKIKILLIQLIKII
jgi:alanyl-tRNA synthetase